MRLTIAAPLLLSVALLVAGCSRPPDLVGIDNPEHPAESQADVSRHRLFIITTREASEVVGALFSAERSSELGLASVDVTIPPNHEVGKVERPRRLPPDPRTEFAVVDPTIYRGQSAFLAQLDAELMKRKAGDRKILLFIHGYNTTTSDAILHLAQFVEDTGFTGVPVLFTWASAAKTPRYVYDLNSALIAREKLGEMANTLAASRAEQVDILAHSMGTFLTMEGLVEAQQRGTLGSRGKINTIMLASPDIDIDLFRTQVTQLPRSMLNRMFLLVSKDDKALRVSRVIAGGVPRVGATDAAELEKLGLTVIDLSEIEDSSSGSHSKFTGSPEVVQLIGAGLNNAGAFQSQSPQLRELIAGVPIRILGN
jgi:esterase/lipase superfamily enzyme